MSDTDTGFQASAADEGLVPVEQAESIVVETTSDGVPYDQTTYQAPDPFATPDLPGGEAPAPAPLPADDPSNLVIPEEPEPDKNDRRPRGWLATDVKDVCDKFITGEIILPEGKTLTPHRVAVLVKEQGGLEKPPSAGAVTAVFKRWQEYKFVVMNEKPFAFSDYTDEGRNVGLAGLIEARSSARKAEKAAEKAASTPLPAPNTDHVEAPSTDS